MQTSWEAKIKSNTITKLSPLDIWVGIASLVICLGFSYIKFLHFYGDLPTDEMPRSMFLGYWLGAALETTIGFVVFLVTYRIIRTIRQRHLVGGEWFFIYQFFGRVAYFVISLIANFENVWEDSRWEGIESTWLGSISMIVVFAAFLVNFLERRILWAFLFATLLASMIMGLWGFQLHESLRWGVRGLAVVALLWDLRQGNKRSVIHTIGTVLFIVGIF